MKKLYFIDFSMNLQRDSQQFEIETFFSYAPFLLQQQLV